MAHPQLRRGAEIFIYFVCSTLEVFAGAVTGSTGVLAGVGLQASDLRIVKGWSYGGYIFAAGS